MRARGIALAAVAGAALAATPAEAAAPKVEQMVVFKSGAAKLKTLRARATHVRVGQRRCAVAAGTPL
ncbi:MAG TPA: hypothetical protein VFQ22_14205, partial [Longimicrobiales bacterium]|nr:hypothetical protein [Longimicrobiales bacterium]